MTKNTEEVIRQLKDVKKRQFDTINENYGEQSLYEIGEGITVYYTNPYTDDTISIIECLMEIQDLKTITISLAEDKDGDYNLIQAEWEE